MFRNVLNALLLYSLKVHALEEEIGGSFKILDKLLSVMSMLSHSTPFLFYKNSFHKNREAENRPEIKNFVRITPGSRSRDL